MRWCSRGSSSRRTARPSGRSPIPRRRAVAYSILGTIKLQQNRLEDSARLLGEAIRLEPRLVGAQLTLAQVYTLQNRPDLALARYQKVFELDPRNPSARLALARSEVEKGNYQQALKLTEPVQPALRESPEGLYVIAAALLKTGKRDEAGSLAADWNRLPNVPQAASIGFGLLLVQEGAIDEGIAVLERAKRTGPPTFELALNLAGAYLLKKDAARALEHYDAALTFTPDSLDALRLAAGVAERNDELERSLSYWLRAKKLAPDDPEILLGFGRVCFKMDLLEDAEPPLAKAASLKPGDIPYQYTLAAVKVGRRQYRRGAEPPRAARQGPPAGRAPPLCHGHRPVHSGTPARGRRRTSGKASGWNRPSCPRTTTWRS